MMILMGVLNVNGILGPSHRTNYKQQKPYHGMSMSMEIMQMMMIINGRRWMKMQLMMSKGLMLIKKFTSQQLQLGVNLLVPTPLAVL